jgi:glycosyltransferase involved in cell wall biosynthesis
MYTGSKLILDAHELETERIGLKGVSKTLFKWIEKFAIKYIDLIVVVSNSIENWYRSTYKITNVTTVRNIPQKRLISQKSNILREYCNLQNEDLLFIYQGSLSNGRNIQMYLNVFSKLPLKYNIVFMGFGLNESLIKHYARKYKNIHFHEAVPAEKIYEYTSSADVGLCLIENKCLSYYYSLPNKLFEYIQADVPTLVSNFPDMKSIVEKYNIGWAVAPTEKDLCDFIYSIDSNEVVIKSNNCQNLSKEQFWENEADVLIKKLKSLLI